MSAFSRTLPPKANLEQQQKLAKELLAAFRRGDREATARIRDALPDKERIVLADAQFTIAREYGFVNWAALRAHIDDLTKGSLSIEERFKRAVHAGDVAELRSLAAHRKELARIVDAPIFSFDSPALLAVSGRGDVELVDAVLALGADPNRKSNWWAGGFHALYAASPAVADRLIAAGAVPDACAAAHLDRIDLLEAMITADPARVHERGGDGQTPLHFARSTRVADLLLDAGADIDARDVDHRSTAAEWMLGDAEDPALSRLDLARHLVARGATADIFLAASLGLTNRARELLERDPTLLDLRTGQGNYGERGRSSYHIYLWTIGPSMTPLQTAARFRQRETLEVMRQFASPAQRLLLACHEGDAEAARAIVRSAPGIIGRLEGADRRALTDEAWIANAPAVSLMMELGFDPSVPSVTGPTGGTALHCAAWEGSVECVSAILRYPSGRALLEQRDTRYGGTPFNWCCHGSRNAGKPAARYAEVARLLIAAGAKVDVERLDVPEEVEEAILEALAKRG